ncbi:MAG: VCBS repeat-containing protein, partial [Candidatus Omnitrophica bacterium]|nr:VCBS repeat-containing protein [Candidatus Omnitrophota bacterium]
LKPASLISQTTQEVLDSYCHLDAGRFARNADPVVIGGGRMGEMMVYSGIHQPNPRSIPGRYVVDRKGNILRHPTIQSSPVFYPNPETGMSDLIVGGEGGAHYYRFTGEFTDHGSPVFEDPVPALQAEADLYAGSLPVPNAVDWDGDGDLDLAVGYSARYDSDCHCYAGGGIQVYRNEGGLLQASAAWQADEGENTYSVTWGDMDGDGDLDLAVG